MKKSNLTAIVRTVSASLKKRSPEILMGIGIAGMVTTTVLAVKATPKAVRLLEEKKEALDAEKLTPAETIKTAWTCYIPAAVTGTLSIACLLGSGSANARRISALAAAYQLSETTLTEYRDKVVETIGPKKEQAVQDAIAKDKMEKNPVSKNEVIMTGKGETLCYDVLSGRYFKSDIEKIRHAVNEINFQMRNDMYVSLNDFYYELGLPNIKLGESLGWNIDRGYMDVQFGSHLNAEGTPCLVIAYPVPPQYGFDCIGLSS